MKKIFMMPAVNIIRFDRADIITDSLGVEEITEGTIESDAPSRFGVFDNQSTIW